MVVVPQPVLVRVLVVCPELPESLHGRDRPRLATADAQRPTRRRCQANNTCKNTRSMVLRRCRSAARRKRVVWGKESTHCR